MDAGFQRPLREVVRRFSQHEKCFRVVSKEWESRGWQTKFSSSKRGGSHYVAGFIKVRQDLKRAMEDVLDIARYRAKVAGIKVQETPIVSVKCGYDEIRG